MRKTLLLLSVLFSVLCFGLAQPAPHAEGILGYYRFPALHGDTIVFTAQGDLWKVSAQGGVAQQITTHPGEESGAAISPDGTQVAFTAVYEGPREVYVMPLEGGLPTRLTYDAASVSVVGWTPDGKVLYATDHFSTLPDVQLVALDPKTRRRSVLPLSQASDGVFDGPDGTLYFTRLPFQGSHTKRYKGGTAQNIWKLAPGAKEAVPLTASYAGTSKTPMWWEGRVYFASDRDGDMNLWSMAPDGSDLRQHTRHRDWDVQSPCLSNGRIVYQLGADLRLYDIKSGRDTALDITLATDLDQTRERWVTRPLDYLTDTQLSADGTKVVLTARGQVFVAPVKQGRFVEVTRSPGVRHRRAQFDPDGKSLWVLSDKTGETEWWRLPANGVGEPTQLTSGTKVLILHGAVAPDGRRIAYTDKNHELWVHTLSTGRTTKVATSDCGEIGDLRWSPDSRWLAFVRPTETFARIELYSVRDGSVIPVTNDRADSYSPAWSRDGEWLTFLSDRTFRSLVGSPWGPRQPEPFFDKQTRIYQIALGTGQRSPFEPTDELQPEKKPEPSPRNPPTVTIETEGLPQRLWDVPVPPGNYDSLSMNDKRLFWISWEISPQRKASLMVLDIGNTDVTPKVLIDDIRGYELSGDGKHLLVRKGNDLHVVDAGAGAPANLDKTRVDLSGWSFALTPREEWRQMLIEAWRLERDYFYDPKLHNLDWPAVLKRHLPLADRVTDRAELSDLTAQMVSELGALHTYVGGGDHRRGTEQVTPASLGALLERDEALEGYRIVRIYQGHPDYPDSLSPLARPGVEVAVGDVIRSVNGVPVLSAPDIGALLRNQAGKQVLLGIRAASTGASREVVVKPITPGQCWNLRYTDWEESRRRLVEEQSQGAIGYVHLRAMGSGDMAQFARDFYPVFNRQGLIIDVRHNGGGNIDSWILEKLMRKAWFYWKARVGKPTWNMQWAFRGHMVVLCNEKTASDGEAFAEGFRRLGLGKVIGTRTWGGEIWLSFSNTLVDNGIASAAELGVYGPEGQWLIEGHGVEPDIVVDNLPHTTFKGEDAQLQAALEYLTKQIRERPVPVPPPPKYPDKSRPAAD